MFSSQQRIKALKSSQLDKSHLCLTGGEEKPQRFFNYKCTSFLKQYAATVCSWMTRLECVNRGKNKDTGSGTKKRKPLTCRRAESLFYWPQELVAAQGTWASTGKAWEELALPPAEGPWLRLKLWVTSSQLCPSECAFTSAGFTSSVQWRQQFWSLLRNF